MPRFPAPENLASSLLVLLLAGTTLAQDSDISLLAGWVALDAPTGHEHLATSGIQAHYSGWQQDRYGNLFKTAGSGAPHRVVACALDAQAYAVSQITEDGYLRLHRIGNGQRHALWDQAHEGQQLRILTAKGPVIGVAAIANGHFAAQHRHETEIVTQDDLWLDIGAESAAEANMLGIALLDPVLRHLPAWSYANEVAGPRSGARIGCAALVAAAQAGLNGIQGSTTYVLSVQQSFGWVGLGAALGLLPQTNDLIVLAPGESRFRNEIVTTLGGRIDTVLPVRVTNSIRIIAPEVQDSGALMERVEQTAAEQILAALVDAVNGTASVPEWLAAPRPPAELNNTADRWGQSTDLERLKNIETTLDRLAGLSAVPGHEGPVRNTVFNAMPAWAMSVVEVDELGNLWVEFGPAGDATVFIAHMDEVGYEIESIAANGEVSLRSLGGVVATAWEGQPALLQLDPNSNRESLAEALQLRGVFLTRNEASERRPESVKAWFGMNSEQLTDAGVRVGMGITGHKEGHRMGAFRYASRALDDRVGSTALLLALQTIDPAQFRNRVIFAWSVREEGGLRGAEALASRFGTQTRRVYSVDTFVSSDTPLESPHFAYTPLGSGPVLRSIENASMATPYELDRNRAIATSAGINVQIGLAQGGTDGTAFTVYGAPNAGLSWPGRYSHTPAEIADLRDVAALVDLIQAMAQAPSDMQ
jgi:putative aminopeptidase